MANFWDLPKPVRETIYRLHLVKDEEVDYRTHYEFTRRGRRARGSGKKEIPAIFLVSSKVQREAAPIYYGENHFVFGRTKKRTYSSILEFTSAQRTRHIRMIRKVTYQWPRSQTGYWYGYEAGAGVSFPELARFKGLEELYLRVDEESMIQHVMASRRTLQRLPPRPLTLQDGVALLRHPGMVHLLKMSGIAHVEFLKKVQDDGNEENASGPIPGGFLETEIAPQLRAQKKKKVVGRRKEAFDILSLPPELRNRIYSFILKLDGPIHPSTESPSSLAKGRKSMRNRVAPGSALNILAVNRQIYDEAYGIFYATNTFEFYYPIQVQAFALGISQDRLRQVRRMTIHYHNANSGGVSLAALSFEALKQLSSLRRLHILFVRSGLKKRLAIGRWGTAPYSIRWANPLDLPGMKKLFELRGITDIIVRDTEFEDAMNELKKDRRYPDGFGTTEREGVYLKFERVLDHVNAALAAAQYGRHNEELLEDREWHIGNDFPPAALEVEEVIEEDEMDATADADGAKAAVEVKMENEIAVGGNDGGNIRDRLRSAGRRSEAGVEGGGHTGGDETEGETEDVIFLGRNRSSDKTTTEDRATHASEMEGEEAGQSEDDAEDEIVVEHVPRPVKVIPAGRIGGLDGAGDGREELDEKDLEESYAAREHSPEM